VVTISSALLALTPHAIKPGMLATDDVPRRALARQPGRASPALVIDPALRAATERGAERRATVTLELMKGAALVAEPAEAAPCGLDVSSRGGSEAAARWFVAEAGAAAALVKGGHRDGPADDCLAKREGDGVTITWLAGERIAGAPVHGTGCALSAAITAGLAAGRGLDEAIARGRSFVREAIAEAEAWAPGGCWGSSRRAAPAACPRSRRSPRC
jgi:hydroxymethylpyrimidine/phosphomethylpyrimidine kinase